MTPSPDLMTGFLAAGRNPRAHVTARWFTLGAGAVCAALGLIDVGAGGAVAAAIGTALVIGFLWSGMLPIFAVRGKDATMAMGLGLLLLTYTARLGTVLVAVVLTQRWDFVAGRWVGVTIIACAMTWIGVHLAMTMRRRRHATR